jgi:addiction module RelE/StbE family toxin
MAKQIIWTYRAQQDRIEILRYWRNRNKSTVYSKNLNLLFKKAILLIAVHPNIGRSTNMAGVRVKLVRDYLIFYEVNDDRLFILSIWDNRKNPDETPYQ